ncbi:MAG: hypothetical protein IJ993_05895 [Akkermansia sp.]|nr:hypothetical protein [Akkermansia sp.]MBR3944108.1 hypothetical protein [Akkermansia sp.]
MKKGKKRARSKKKKTRGARGSMRTFRASRMPEIVLTLMALSIVACFFISAPWSGVLFIFGMVVCPCMLYVHVRMGKKSGRASRYRHAECDSEHGDTPGWEAAQLMYGLSRKDHYKDLPPEVREKSIFGKRD